MDANVYLRRHRRHKTHTGDLEAKTKYDAVVCSGSAGFVSLAGF